MNSERAALADQTIEEQRGRLRQRVILDEELLEFVDHQQHARQRLIGARVAESRQILHADAPEQLAAILQQRVQPLQDADAELAIAFDGDDSGMRQPVSGVGLELDTLLEVDQIELDFIGAVMQRGVGDERMQQRRFSGAGLAGDQHMLRRSLAESQVLQLGGPRATDRDVQSGPCAGRPELIGGRHHSFERHFDAADRTGQLPREAHQFTELVGGRWWIEDQRPVAQNGIGEPERTLFRGIIQTRGNRFRCDDSASGRCGVVRNRCRDERQVFQRINIRPARGRCQTQDGRVPFDVRQRKRSREILGFVDAHQHEDAALHSPFGDADQPTERHVGEVGREVRHDHDPVRFRDFARVAVVVVEGRVFIAQIGLQHVLHVLGHIGQTLLDVRRLGPDPAGHQLFVDVGQVHERGEVGTEADGIEDREPDLSRRQRCEESEHRGLQQSSRVGAIAAARTDNQ